eukprot:m.245148 g.245148  ORF g.245148 m.245148 type:complete len:200 (+) comp19048_c4_seq5:30-629(+)
MSPSARHRDIRDMGLWLLVIIVGVVSKARVVCPLQLFADAGHQHVLDTNPMCGDAARRDGGGKADDASDACSATKAATTTVLWWQYTTRYACDDVSRPFWCWGLVDGPAPPPRERVCPTGTCRVLYQRQQGQPVPTDVDALLFYGARFNVSDLPADGRGTKIWALFHEESPQVRLRTLLAGDANSCFRPTVSIQRRQGS